MHLSSENITSSDYRTIKSVECWSRALWWESVIRACTAEVLGSVGRPSVWLGGGGRGGVAVDRPRVPERPVGTAAFVVVVAVVGGGEIALDRSTQGKAWCRWGAEERDRWVGVQECRDSAPRHSDGQPLNREEGWPGET